MEDFARCVEMVCSASCPDPAARLHADQWLTAFRARAEAWGVVQDALRNPDAPLHVRLQAAQVLAWKAKRQLQQLQPPAAQAALAEALTAAVAAMPRRGPDAAVGRALCVALANLAIQCTDWVRPLETLGPRLSREAMLDFLTVLPQECEDREAATAGGAPAPGLRDRVREWCVDVAAWLAEVQAAEVAPLQRQALAAGGGGGLEEAVLAAEPPARALTAAVVRAFSAWVKWGCLPYLEPRAGEYLVRVAGAALFAPPDDPAGLLPAGVDAASECIERGSEAAQPALLALALRLPGRAAALAGAPGGEGAEEVAHVFSLFSSTHPALAASAGGEGQALRQGLLGLALLPEPVALAAVRALVDVAMHALHALGEASEQGGGGGEAAPPMDRPAAAAFAAAVLDVLLVKLQAEPGAFQWAGPGMAEGLGGDGSPSEAGAQEGRRSPEHVPEMLRGEAEVLVELCAELLGGEGVAQRLQAALEPALQRHGPHSLQAAQTLDVCLSVLGSASGIFPESNPRAGPPAPAWIQYVLRVLGMVPHVHGGGAPSGEAVTVLQFDFFAALSALAPALFPVLARVAPDSYEGLAWLVLEQAQLALSSPHRSPDVSCGSSLDVVDAAADALRALCSSATAAAFPATSGLLAALDGMAQRLAPARGRAPAQQQVVVAVVHAVHALPPGQPTLAAQAAAVVERQVFTPLAASLQHAQHVAAGMPRVAAGSPGVQAGVVVLRAAAAAVASALRRVQALLNAFESYADGSSPASTPAEQAAAQPVRAAAVGSLLGAWPLTAELCRRAAALPEGGEAFRDVYCEVAHCLASCMALDPAAAAACLPCLADTAAACFFLPGGHALHRPLCSAVDVYCPQPRYQGPLLATLGAVLSAPAAAPLLRSGGPDADPETALALLSLAGCLFREARRWGEVPAPKAALPAVDAGLALALASAPCNHRDLSQRALATLSCLALLALEAGGPFAAVLAPAAQRRGGALLQGALLALLSLNSASSLPKVVSLLADVALLAVRAAQAAGAQGPAALAEGATQLLRLWLQAAVAGVGASGAAPPAAASALADRCDWAPLLQQAAVHAAQAGGLSPGQRPGVLEARRALQRSVRQAADAVRQVQRPGGGLF